MPRLGVCSWSLRPASPADLASKVRAVGISAVQLALDPLREGAWGEHETLAALEGITILSGMMGTKGEDYTTLDSIRATGGVVPDEHWEENLARARANAAIAARLGVRLVTFHAGFIPHGESPARRVLVDRIHAVADAFAAHGVDIALETGQEDAATLLAFLNELVRPSVGVNFDPANMILYGMGDPMAALAALAPRVRQVHIKDAIPGPARGQWGAETPAGRGAVRWADFCGVAKSAGLLDRCDLVIERESGDERIADCRTAAALARGLAPGIA